MSGYNTILRFRRVEEQVERLGFMFCHPKHGYGGDSDYVALRPKDADAVPIYSRDAELFVGTLEDLVVWLRGVEWARSYDMMLRITDDKKRARAEVKERARQAEARKREEQKKMLAILRASDRENLNPKK
jgi:hypothetical protein